MSKANRSTQIDKRQDERGSQPAVPQTGTKPGDARDLARPGDADEEKLRANRDELGVEESHRTEDMERGRRGTFP